MQGLAVACFNWVFADSSGNIGYQASGRIPVRRSGGTFPHVVKDGTDNWQGWIEPDQMPGQINPEKSGWGPATIKRLIQAFPIIIHLFLRRHFVMQG